MGRLVKGIDAVGGAGSGKVNVFFDTGSDWDLVSEETAKHLGDAKLPGGGVYEIEMADGSTVRTNRLSLLLLQVNGCQIALPAPVLPGLKHDVVIGNRTMQAHEMRLDMPGETVHIGRCRLSV